MAADGLDDGPADELTDWLGAGEVVLVAVGGLVVGLGETGGVVEAAGALGGFDWGAGSVAFGLRDSTLVFSRFTSFIRSCLLAPSFMDCTVLLTSAS